MPERKTAVDAVPLSVTIVAKNESSRIRACIESVRWADDVLLIDDASSDDTVNIARSLGARVLLREPNLTAEDASGMPGVSGAVPARGFEQRAGGAAWSGAGRAPGSAAPCGRHGGDAPFGQAPVGRSVRRHRAVGTAKRSRPLTNEGNFRNWTLGQVRNEWVLKLDADERVTPELAEEIKALLKGSPIYRGYAIPRRNYIGDYWVRHGGWYPARQLVLFRKSYFRWEEVEVHPKVFLDGPCGQLNHDIIHYSYRDFTHFFEKLNRQSTWEAEKWLKERRKIGPWLCARKMVDRFLKTYLLKQGYRDGFVGFAIAVFNGLYQFASFAKYWEFLRAEKKQSGKTASAS